MEQRTDEKNKTFDYGSKEVGSVWHQKWGEMSAEHMVHREPIALQR